MAGINLTIYEINEIIFVENPSSLICDLFPLTEYKGDIPGNGYIVGDQF